MIPGKNLLRTFLAVLLLLLLAVPARAGECPHEWVLKRIEPTCDGRGMTWRECTLCGETTDYLLLDPLGHTFGEWYVLTAPTCTQIGEEVRECGVCAFQETAQLPKLGHSYTVEVVPPTCTARGHTRHTCIRCPEQYLTDYTPPLGHRYEGVVILEPTLTTMGRMLYTCIGCGDTYQEYIPKLTNPFVDLNKNAYYFTPVLWAVNNGITSGMDETHFVPDGICTRAQVVTFLWRSAGKPEPTITANPFRDVPGGCYYEKAVLWAYNTGITMGTDALHFSPTAPCSRAQVVTFLHRFRGCPEPEITSVFPDVRPGAYYNKAVSWAAQRGITVGMDGGYFCPDLSCTRAQIVTFLYRDAKNP